MIFGLFPAGSYIASNPGDKIIPGLTGEGTGRPGDNIPKISCADVGINESQFLCSVGGVVTSEIHDSSQGWRRNTGTAKDQLTAQSLARGAVIYGNSRVGVRVERKIRCRAMRRICIGYATCQLGIDSYLLGPPPLPLQPVSLLKVPL